MKTKMEQNLFSFDAETNGLWGKAFSIGAIVYSKDGEELARFVSRCPIEGEVNEWVEKNVLPQMTEIPVTNKNYNEMLADFAKFYLANKANSLIVAHMGVPVESSLLKDMHTNGYIGDWDGPYPFIDLAGMLLQANEDPTSVDFYVQKYDLKVKNFGSSHNPLYDSEVAAKVFLHLRR